MPDVTITARKNGPLMAQGTIKFIDRDGNELEQGPMGLSYYAGAAGPRTSRCATAPTGQTVSATGRPKA